MDDHICVDFLVIICSNSNLTVKVKVHYHHHYQVTGSNSSFSSQLASSGIVMAVDGEAAVINNWTSDN